MAARRAPLPGEHYSCRGNVYRVTRTNIASDEVFLYCLNDGKEWVVSFTVFFAAYERVVKVKDVAAILGRNSRSIYRYEAAGLMEKPMTAPDGAGRQVRFYTVKDILDAHELLAEVHQGRPRSDRKVTNNTLPTRAAILEEIHERYGVWQ